MASSERNPGAPRGNPDRGLAARTVEEALVLRCWDYSETSQTVALLARDTGIVRGIAKGARRERSSFSGGFEVLTRGEVVYLAKPGVELANLVEWDLREVFWEPRRSLGAHRAGLYMIDATRHALIDHDPHPDLYGALVLALRALGDTTGTVRTVAGYQWRLLTETGYQPELSRDVRTSDALARAPVYEFSPELGGFSTSAEPARSSENAGASASDPAVRRIWLVRSSTLGALRALGEAASACTADAVPEAIASRACRLLEAYLAWIRGRPLRSARDLLGPEGRSRR